MTNQTKSPTELLAIAEEALKSMRDSTHTSAVVLRGIADNALTEIQQSKKSSTIQDSMLANFDDSLSNPPSYLGNEQSTPEVLASNSTERERFDAIKEGQRNNATEEYFKARPQLDSVGNRRIFEKGFDAALNQKAPAQQPVVFIHRDQLQKAKKEPLLCHLVPKADSQAAEWLPLFTSPQRPFDWRKLIPKKRDSGYLCAADHEYNRALDEVIAAFEAAEGK